MRVSGLHERLQRIHAVEIAGDPAVRADVENRVRADGNDIRTDEHIRVLEEHVDVAVRVRFRHQRVVDRLAAEGQALRCIERLRSAAPSPAGADTSRFSHFESTSTPSQSFVFSCAMMCVPALPSASVRARLRPSASEC